MRNKLVAGTAAIGLAGIASTAMAGQPTPWQTRMQPAANEIMEQVIWFEVYTLWFIVPITLLVMVLIAWCILRYRERVNPTPSRTSHNTAIEVIWTLGPVIILLLLAVPSFQLLTAQYTMPEEPAVTIKATGNQWNWDYEYQFEEPLSFNASLLFEEDRESLGKQDVAEYPRLLATDNDVVVPVNATVRVLVTASDVIHAFAVPAFGIKVDAVPGRINETWFKATREGIFYGQCSELCGKDHAYMPIAIRVVSQELYENWVATAQDDLQAANSELMAAIESGARIASAGN